MSIKDWFRRHRIDKMHGDSPQYDGYTGNAPAGPPEDDVSRPPPVDPPPSGMPTSDSGSPDVPVTLADITRGMQHAASAANQLIAHQYMQALDPFFEHSDDGRLIPKTIEMKLDEQYHFDLPLVALATPRGLMLEKMKAYLTVRTDAVEQENINPDSSKETVSLFHVSMSPPGHDGSGRDSGHVVIEMEFIVLPPPESVMRLIDEYTNQVLPKKNKQEQ